MALTKNYNHIYYVSQVRVFAPVCEPGSADEHCYSIPSVVYRPIQDQPQIHQAEGQTHLYSLNFMFKFQKR